jgi:hypothetical protein
MVGGMIGSNLQIDMVQSKWYARISSCSIEWLQMSKSAIVVACSNTLLVFCHWIPYTDGTEDIFFQIEHQIRVEMIEPVLIPQDLNMIDYNIMRE